MKRLVLFVEGEGEDQAVPALIAKLLEDQVAWDVLFLDSNTFRVGQVNKLVKDKFRDWKKKLKAAMLRKDVGGVLLLLDGDVKKFGGEQFCAANAARQLAAAATDVGAGATFSVAIVFAMREFESWLIAGVESLAGVPFTDGRPGVKENVAPPEGDLEQAPRDAKGWLSRNIPGGYKPTRDQGALTQMLDHQLVRRRGLRSFQRLDAAVGELVNAMREDKHVATPSRTD